MFVKLFLKKKSGTYDFHLGKTLPVCKFHHGLIHAGKYDGESLKNLFNSFKENGVGFNKAKAEALIMKASKSGKAEKIRYCLE